MSSADSRAAPPRRASSAPASSCSTRCFASKNFRKPDGKVQAERIFRRQWRLRGECGGRDRAARRPRRARRPDGRPRRRRRQRRPRAQGARARESRLQLLSAHRRARDGAVGDFHECARRPHHRDLSRRAHRRDRAGRCRRPSSPRPTRCWPTTAIRISCSRSARRRARRGLPVVLDGDRPTVEDDPLFRLATHVIFSSECLRETTGVADLGDGLAAHRAQDRRVSRRQQWAGRHRLSRRRRAAPPAGVQDRRRGYARRRRRLSRRLRAGAGGRAEARSTAMRFGAAVAGIKCTRLGGSAGAPTRPEVEALLAHRAASRNRPLDLEYFSI